MSNSSSKTPRFVKIVSPLALAIALAACGGGGSSSFGTDSGSGGTTTTEGERPSADSASIDVVADSYQLLSDGSKSIGISAIAKDDDGVAISDAEITFSVDSGATLVVDGSTATLTLGSAVLGDEVTVTVQSGEQTKQVVFEVIEQETVTENGETVASIDISSDSLELLADGSQAVNITAIAKNEFNNAISDVEFSFTVDKSATLVVKGNSAALTPNGSGLGTLTVTVTSGDITDTIQIEVIETVSQAESDIKLGSFDDDNNFVVGSLKISDSNLEAGGKTSIKVSLVDSTNSNEPYIENVQVTFISRCIAEGLASVSDVSLNAGVATVDYEAKGCSGDDEISVSAIVDGKAIKASSTINTAEQFGTISF